MYNTFSNLFRTWPPRLQTVVQKRLGDSKMTRECSEQVRPLPVPARACQPASPAMPAHADPPTPVATSPPAHARPPGQTPFRRSKNTSRRRKNVLRRYGHRCLAAYLPARVPAAPSARPCPRMPTLLPTNHPRTRTRTHPPFRLHVTPS